MFKLKNGQEMPKLALGTYLMEGEQVFKAVDKALAVGYRSFDTAKYYNNEKELGDALKVLLPRYNLTTEDVFITTKVFPDGSENSEEVVISDVEDSLKLLGREYLDLVLIHYPRPLSTSNSDERNKEYRKSAWQALEKIHAAGRIRAIGVSNYEPNHLNEMKEYLQIEPQVNQVEYHPHFQRSELRKYCQQNGILFQSFSPLGRGNATLLSDEALVRIANAHQTTVATVILAWIMNGKNGVVAKSVNDERIEENFKAVPLVLTDDEFARINELDRSKPYVEDEGWNVV